MRRELIGPVLAVLALLATGCARAPEGAVPAHSTEFARSSVPVRPAHRLVVPAGTFLRVRIDQTVDTDRSRPGDEFTGSLATPLVMDGETVAPRGAPVKGFIQKSVPSGRLRGRAVISLGLRSLEIRETRVELDTDSITRVSEDHRNRNIAMIGGGSGIGALIGGLTGGGKAALIGAGAGAAAGTASAAVTGERNVRIPAETVLAFRLREPVTL